MKSSRTLSLVLLTGSILALPCWQTTAQTDEAAIAVVRSVIKADRKAVVTETLQLTDIEAGKFWPLYQQYRAEMDKVGDALLRLVQEYGKYYPNVPEDRAKKMLKDHAALEKKQVATRASYLKKFGKVLPAEKNLRFAQVENRLDLALRLELAANVPLVPIEGRMTGATTSSTSIVPGVPGGVAVQTVEVTATVASIDRLNRKVTLVSSDGIRKTVKVGPDAINFDQIRIGDRLKVTAAEELVVQMSAPGESATGGAATLVALAPKGAKPGGVIAETTQITARVTAIDATKRTATLRFEDGSSKTFPVRSDLDLSKRKVGEQVVFRVTEMVAIIVEKQ